MSVSHQLIMNSTEKLKGTHHKTEIATVQHFMWAGQDVCVQRFSKPHHRRSQEATTAGPLAPETQRNGVSADEKSRAVGKAERWEKQSGEKSRAAYRGSCSTGIWASCVFGSGALRRQPDVTSILLECCWCSFKDEAQMQNMAPETDKARLIKVHIFLKCI